REARRKVALVDLDLFGGDVATMMNIDVSGPLVDLLEEPDLDPGQVDSYLVPHISGVRVLPAPASLTGGRDIPAARVREVLVLLKHGYDFVVVDAPPVPDALLHPVLDEAEIIVLPVVQDLVSVKRTRAILEWLGTLHLRAEVRLVLNQAGIENGIKIQDFERSLGGSFAVRIPWEEKVVRAAANKGQPFALGHIHSGAARSIGELARQLAGTGESAPGWKGPRFRR
ncbi:MAG: histidine kinase, partial [Firmicutes bacterium]|nr:histidine kinase [Bacillota bacterium]